MDDLIDTVHIDAKHSTQDVVEPMAVSKRRWGDRVARRDFALSRHVRICYSICCGGLAARLVITRLVITRLVTTGSCRWGHRDIRFCHQRITR